MSRFLPQLSTKENFRPQGQIWPSIHAQGAMEAHLRAARIAFPMSSTPSTECLRIPHPSREAGQGDGRLIRRVDDQTRPTGSLRSPPWLARADKPIIFVLIFGQEGGLAQGTSIRRGGPPGEKVAPKTRENPFLFFPRPRADCESSCLPLEEISVACLLVSSGERKASNARLDAAETNLTPPEPQRAFSATAAASSAVSASTRGVPGCRCRIVPPA